MSTEERLARVEEAFVTLTRLVKGMEGKMILRPAWLDSLSEAQVKSKEALARLAEAQSRRDEDEKR